MAGPIGGSLRNLKGYAITQAPPTGNVRNVKGYAITVATPALPTVTDATALYPLINAQTRGGPTWSASNSTLGTPTADATVPGYNTKIRLTPAGSSGYGGYVDLWYHRRSIDDLAPTPKALAAIPSNTTVRALLADVNSKYGWSLQATDVVDDPVAAGSAYFAITAASTSLVFRPGSVTTVGNVQPLANLTTNLPGFHDVNGNGPKNGNMVSILNFDGAEGATTFTDEILPSRVWTRGGSAVITQTEKKFGLGSLSVPTGADYLSNPGTDFQFTGDFTIACWLKPRFTGVNQAIWAKGSNFLLQWYANAYYIRCGGASYVIQGVTGVSDTNWHHMAFVRKGTTLYLFHDGNLVGTASYSGQFGNDSSLFNWGAWDGGLNFQGYLDGCLLAKEALWSANFTPPTTPPSA